MSAFDQVILALHPILTTVVLVTAFVYFLKYELLKTKVAKMTDQRDPKTEEPLGGEIAEGSHGFRMTRKTHRGMPVGAAKAVFDLRCGENSCDPACGGADENRLWCRSFRRFRLSHGARLRMCRAFFGDATTRNGVRVTGSGGTIEYADAHDKRERR